MSQNRGDDWRRRFGRGFSRSRRRRRLGKDPRGNFGGKGVESNEEHGGKVWRFEAVGKNGGTGVDSSAEELGTKDIVGDGFGGVVRSEERIQDGTVDRRDR